MLTSASPPPPPPIPPPNSSILNRFEHALDIGVEAGDAKELAEKTAMKRGSITFDVTPQYREMKAYLDDPSCQTYLGKFMKRCFMQESLFFWIDINDYALIPTSDYRKCKALQLIKRYIAPGASMEVGFLEADVVEKYLLIEQKLREGREPDETLFDKASNSCFREMVVNTLEPFKKSPEFEEWKQNHQESLKVLVTDFDYMAILGQGGFGRVVHARKKTTGKHFAMKIQPKCALYAEHGGNLGSLHTEKTVFANCQHPFIVDMCYALQTAEHAILVLGLVDGGDLNDLLWNAPHGRLEEFHARIYTAQIAMALSHLHEVGIIFRDLKPENVLICGRTGNTKLTDMGLAAPIVAVEAREDQIVPSTSALNDKWDLQDTNDNEENKNDDKEESDEEDDMDNTAAVALTQEEIASLADLSLERSQNPGEISPRTLGDDAIERKGMKRGSMLVRSSRMDEPSTMQLLIELERKASCQSSGPPNVEVITAAKKKIKRLSVVGTRGFMAPEIIKQKPLARPERTGYDEGVDWFALGVTSYMMLTGGIPFSPDEPTELDPQVVLKEFPRDGKGRIRRPSGFAALMQKVRFPSFMSHSSCHFCKDLLHIHPEERLGSKNGIKDIQNHDWMARLEKDPTQKDLTLNNKEYSACTLPTLDFEKLMALEYEIPHWVYVTERTETLKKLYAKDTTPKYNHYDHMMATFAVRNPNDPIEWNETPKSHEQEVFESWDFMSYAALKDEMSCIDEVQGP
jgi:serine/threonine protein kinase